MASHYVELTTRDSRQLRAAMEATSKVREKVLQVYGTILERHGVEGAKGPFTLYTWPENGTTRLQYFT